MKHFPVILLLCSCASNPPPVQIQVPSLLLQPIEIPKREFSINSKQEEVGVYIVELIQALNEANIQIESTSNYIKEWNKIQEKR